jgi:hypothetical protein
VTRFCENCRETEERNAHRADEDFAIGDRPLVFQQLLHPAVQVISHVDLELICAPKPFSDLPKDEDSILSDLTPSISETKFGKLLQECPEIAYVPLAKLPEQQPDWQIKAEGAHAEIRE